MALVWRIHVSEPHLGDSLAAADGDSRVVSATRSVVTIQSSSLPKAAPWSWEAPSEDCAFRVPAP